jgi:hypothetical protein
MRLGGWLVVTHGPMECHRKKNPGGSRADEQDTYMANGTECNDGKQVPVRPENASAKPKGKWVTKFLRPRFSIRWLMVFVAVVATFLTAEKIRRTWQARSLKAAAYSAEAKSWSDDAAKVESMMVLRRSRSDPASLRRLADLDGIAKNYRDHERFNRELASKYARAAARPWLPIESEQ